MNPYLCGAVFGLLGGAVHALLLLLRRERAAHERTRAELAEAQNPSPRLITLRFEPRLTDILQRHLASERTYSEADILKEFES